ncbi:MAG: DUF5702 domain-containing protein, partial [Anaerovoracaceae bacterium]
NNLQYEGKHFFDYEVEYIIKGKYSDELNRSLVRTDLILFRNAANLLFIYTNPQMLEIVTAAAAATGPAAPAIQILLSESWALAEAINDVKLLENNKKVPIYKTNETWALDLETVAKNLEKNKENPYVDNNADIGFTYQDYLQFFLFFEDREVKLHRIMDLIQINFQGKHDREFLIKEHNFGFDFKALVNKREYIYEEKY